MTVRVDTIEERPGFKSYYATKYSKRAGTAYACTSLSTGRKITFRSAAKFRREVRNEKNVNQWDVADAESNTEGPVEEALNKVEYCIGDEPDCCEGEPGELCPACGKLVPIVKIPAAQPISTPTASVTVESTSRGSSLALLIQKSQASKPTGGRKPTAEQEVILKTGKGLRKGNVLVIQAGAGTGKTTTLTMLEKVLQGLGQYTAFNHSLVAESKRKFNKAACNTTHSLAFRAVGKTYAHRLNGNRVRSDEVARMLGISDLVLSMGVDEKGEPREKRLAAGFLAGQLTQALRRFCQSADREIGPEHFKYLDGIDMPSSDGQRTYINNEKVRDYLLPFAAEAWKDACSTQGRLPFSHDYYVKIWQLNKPVIAANYILLDEAQDTAPVMLDILKQQDALIVVVGDSAQQIYEWRGAVDAMIAFQDAEECYLTQSFRFGQAVADVANAVLATINGITLRLKGLASLDSKVEAIEEPKCILCRTNAAAVANVLNYIRDGKKAHLVGGGAEVVAFVRGAQSLQRGQSTSHPDLACFSSWTEVEEYVKLDEGEELKLWVKLIKEFTCEAILEALENMPTEKAADVVVCTAHKSKGREWPTVKLASDFPTESKAGDADRKLLYVAATRAQLGLDITECPFFTGKDSLGVIPSPKPVADVEVPSVVPPTPATPPAPTEFTWSKDRDGGWNVRGTPGHTGTVVDVVRRDGSKSQRKLLSVVWEGNGVSIYKV